jgi:hypothetical protein
VQGPDPGRENAEHDASGKEKKRKKKKKSEGAAQEGEQSAPHQSITERARQPTAPVQISANEKAPRAADQADEVLAIELEHFGSQIEALEAHIRLLRAQHASLMLAFKKRNASKGR